LIDQLLQSIGIKKRVNVCRIVKIYLSRSRVRKKYFANTDY